jgi:hypothetical protein
MSSRPFKAALLAFAIGASFGNAQAQTAKGDGVITIDQAKALAGGVAPGDAAGFPVTLSQPGSYKLTGNLTVPDADTTAIEIVGASVTLDLNGFSIIGPSVCNNAGQYTQCSPTGTGAGVLITSPASYSRLGVAVFNGTIRGMGKIGIESASQVGGARFEQLQIVGNGLQGVLLHGSVLRNSVVTKNGGTGVSGSRYLLHDNIVEWNGYVGVTSGPGYSAGSGNLIGAHPTVTASGLINIGANFCGYGLCP